MFGNGIAFLPPPQIFLTQNYKIEFNGTMFVKFLKMPIPIHEPINLY